MAHSGITSCLWAHVLRYGRKAHIVRCVCGTLACAYVRDIKITGSSLRMTACQQRQTDGDMGIIVWGIISWECFSWCASTLIWMEGDKKHLQPKKGIKYTPLQTCLSSSPRCVRMGLTLCDSSSKHCHIYHVTHLCLGGLSHCLSMP